MTNETKLVSYATPSRPTAARGVTVAALALVMLAGRSVLPAWGAAADQPPLPAGVRQMTLQSGDVVAFLGGEPVVQELEQGHLESLLAAAFPGEGIRYRNMGWEGDTVFEQPRDVNFPGVPEQLERVKATVVFCQFGRFESLAGADGLPAFVAAYERLCDEVTKRGARVVLVTPPPFGKPASPLLPDLSAGNADVKVYAAAVKELAERRGFPCVDLFGEASDRGLTAVTDEDGLRLSPRGSALLALAAARQLGLGRVAERAGEPDEAGRWSSPEMERLRAAVVAKNEHWFNYWRPMNWAFLGGNRTEVPSSFAPGDATTRIFPAEMEKFVPLIQQAEARVEERAVAAGGGS